MSWTAAFVAMGVGVVLAGITFAVIFNVKNL